MRSRLLAALAGLTLLAACSDTGTPPAAFAPRMSQIIVCPDADSARALIRSLFTGPALSSAVSQYNTIRRLFASGKTADAQALTLKFVDFALRQWYADALIGGRSNATALRLVALVEALYCQVELPPPSLSPSSLGPDGAAQVLGPGSPTTLVRTQTRFSGVNVPGGSVPSLTLVTITRLPDAPGPLLTPLDQFPAFYEFAASPPVAFSQDVVVGVCQAQAFDPATYGRFRLAHNVGNTVEILPRVDAPFLDCAALLGTAPLLPGWRGYAARGWHWLVNAVLPPPAFALTLGTCCLGGSARTFSPFGAVDPLLVLDALNPVLRVASNTAIPPGDLPTVRLHTPNGSPVAGVTVTFALLPGSEGSISGAVQLTDQNGLARLGGWTVGAGQAPNAVTATATPLPGTSVQGNGVIFEASLR